MRSYWNKTGLNSMKGSLQEMKRTQTQRRLWDTEAEIGVMMPQSKGHQKSPEAVRDKVTLLTP